jgi:hypothetical protein
LRPGIESTPYLKIHRTMLKNGWRVTKCFQEAWKCLVSKKAAWTQSSSFQLGEFFMSYNCFSISQKLSSSVEGATISLLSKIMHFLQKVQLCYSCLIEKGLEGLRMTKESYICIWHWMAVLEEDINHRMYSPKGSLHQCCASTQKIWVPRVGSGSRYLEPTRT